MVTTLLYIVFVLAAIVLTVVILIQEGKGGGLGDAFGSAGQQTFGVGSSGINRFTGITGAIFLGSALSIHILNRINSESSVVEGLGVPGIEAPAFDPGAPAPPTGDTGGGDDE